MELPADGHVAQQAMPAATSSALHIVTDDTVHQPSDRLVSSARAGDRGHLGKSERVTITSIKHQRSSSCE